MPTVTSFLTLLSQWDSQEIEEKLNQRVEFSKRAIGKLLQVNGLCYTKRSLMSNVLCRCNTKRRMGANRSFGMTPT